MLFLMGTLGRNMSAFGSVKVSWGGRGDKGDVVWQTNHQVQCSKYMLAGLIFLPP